MSIVLRANQLNTILYKYLLEAGLTHTAYSLFNQAALAQPLQEFRFDIRSGHLLSLLQKSLVYAQIEAHVGLNEYLECGQPFHLLKPHTCKVVERAKKQKEQLMRELGDQLNDSIKRTNSAYNTAIANRDFDEIVYDARGKKYFQKFAKIRLPTSQSDKTSRFIVKGTGQAPLLHNIEDFQIDLLRYDDLNDQIVIDKIFPCVSDGKLNSPIDFACAGEYLVQLYPKNKVTLFKLLDENLSPIQFSIGGDQEAKHLLPNTNLTQLVAITSASEFWVLNLNTLKLILHESGSFSWREFDEYLVIDSNSIHIHSLCSKQPLLNYVTQHDWSQISFNSQKNLYALISYSEKLVHINTFQSNQPLFVFDLSQEGSLKQALWISSNNVDYFCWLTDTQIKVYDLALNSYSKVIDISEYDTLVTKISTIRKSDRDEFFLLALGSQNILAYDVTNAKIERIEVAGKASELFTLNSEKLALVMDSCIYFLVGQYIELLFK